MDQTSKIARMMILALAFLSFVPSQAVAEEFLSMIKKANSFVDDQLIVHDRLGKYKPFAAIGIVQTKRNIQYDGRLTPVSSNAFLVSPCYILTVHHGVFGEEQPPAYDDLTTARKEYAVNFITVDDNDNMEKSITASPVKWGDLHLPPNVPGKDWVFLKLDICQGKQTGWFDIRGTDGDDLMKLATAGIFYPNAAPAKTLTTSLNCDFFEWVPYPMNVALNYCRTKLGTSGSPVITYEDGKPKVVAMQVAAMNPDNVVGPRVRSRSSAAINLFDIEHSIYLEMKADKAAYYDSIRAIYKTQRGSDLPANYNPAYDFEVP